MLKHNASSPSSPSSSKTADTDWAHHEFAHAHLPDQRLVSRLITLMTDFARHPTAPITQACGSWSKSKAAYRFFDNDSVNPQDILAAHTQATLARMRPHPIVLCPQDTTSLNDSTHPQTKGLGPIGNRRDKIIGLFLPSTLALTPSGQPLGFLHAHSWARSAQNFGRSSRARHRTPLAEKESQRWLDSLTACQAAAAPCAHTTLVNVADREGDLYELFAQALAPSGGPRVPLLVRAQHHRQVAHPQKYLWGFLAGQRVGARLKIQVPRQDGQPGRLATLSIR